MLLFVSSEAVESNLVKLHTSHGTSILPAVDVIKLLLEEIQISQKLRNGKKFVTMSESAQKCENQAIFKQNYTLELFIALEMVYYCCFS